MIKCENGHIHKVRWVDYIAPPTNCYCGALLKYFEDDDDEVLKK